MTSLKLLRTLVVDDEKPARDLLVSLLKTDPAIQLVGTCATGDEALSFLARHAVDLLFLDIQMPGLNGFDVVHRLEGEPLPRVVFVTAHDEFAVAAFEVRALDYLLKPFAKSRLFDTLHRAQEQFRTAAWEAQARKLADLLAAARPSKPGGYVERFQVQTGTRLLLIPVDRITHLESDDHYTRLWSEGASHLVLRTMASLEADLDPAMFARIHRTTIVNLGRMVAVRSSAGAFWVELSDGSRHRISRSRRQLLERLLHHGTQGS
jgi:two-component system LytT family response regulator